jgi:TPR repeat protein
MLEEGEGVDKDEARAADLYRKSCQGGYQPGCEAAERVGGR